MNIDSKVKEKQRNSQGITLIALVVTIVILIILATISISALFGENGLIKKAQEARDHQSNAVAMEQGEMDELADEYANLLEEGNGEETPTEPPVISTSTNYVGYYANLDDDPEPEGVIYADLAVAKNGQWKDADGAYSYSAITNAKDYYISSETDYAGVFGTKPIISAVSGSEGEDRFYVMSLSDFITDSRTTFCWYDAMDSDVTTPTSTAFGQGEANTAKMITQWNAGAYGTKDSNGTGTDVWGVIQTKVIEGWFVPSRGEWSAFGDNLNVSTSNFIPPYGLSTAYWSSSQKSAGVIWDAATAACLIGSASVGQELYVRLSTIF